MISMRRPFAYLRAHRLAAALLVVALTGVSIVLLLFTNSDEDERRAELRAEALTRSDDMAGMDMSGDGSVQLTPAQISEFGIAFATVELRELTSGIRSFGTIAVDETRLTAVTTKVAGFVELLHVDFTGRPVGRGQPLYDIYSPDVVAAQEELLLARRLQSSQSDIPGVARSSVDLAAAARQRLRSWDITEAQIDAVLRSGTARRTVTMYSPVTGIVLEKSVVAGQAIEPGDLLYRIADLSRVWIEVEVREADAALLATGAMAIVESNATPGRMITGRVEYVYPTVTADTRSLRARISAANPNGAWRPGMYVTVLINIPGRTALTIPNSAVVNTGNRSIVFVDFGGGRITPQVITAGRVSDEYTEVISGLEPGQRVVTSAQFLLDSESNLAEVMRSMMSQGAGGMESMDMPGMNMPSPRR